jgi:HAE1 family hydrophobic/amphiphilic exporter-1
MNISAPFIARPIATALLMVGLLLGGLAAYPLLPVAALPNVNYPTLQVTAQLPGADPQTMASSVATPLETQFGQIPGLTQMTSSSALGYTQITLQFDLSRQIDGAVSDTLSAINAASSYLPPNLPYPPTINKVNPADTPILVLALTSDTLPLTTVDAYAENILLQKISQISGVGLVGIAGRQKPAIRIQLDPQALAARGLSLEDVRSVISVDNVDLPKGTLNSPRQTYTLNTNDQLFKPEAYGDLIIAYRNGSPVRVKDVGKAIDGPENNLIAAWFNKQRAIILPVQRSPGANVVATVDRIKAMMPVLKASIPSDIKIDVVSDRTETIRASVADVQFTARTFGRVGGDGHLSVPAQRLGNDHSRRHRATVVDRHVCGAVRAGLQPRQSLLDGFDDRDRLRRRRRRGRDREYRAPSGRGTLADAGRPQERRRDRLHDHIDYPLAHCRLHSALPHGRLRRCAIP